MARTVTVSTHAAVVLIDRVRIMLAKEKAEGRETPFNEEIEKLLMSFDIGLPVPCERHHIRGVRCSACLQSPRGVNWGWAGDELRIR